MFMQGARLPESFLIALQSPAQRLG
jgi:hypothetical protein